MKLCSAAKKAPWLVSLSLALPACMGDVGDTNSSLDVKTGAETAAPAVDATALTFLILYKLPAVPPSVAADVKKAGGTLVAAYPEIGVAIARSASSSFVSTLQKNFWVDTVTPTQTAAVNALPSLTANVKSSMPQPAANQSTTDDPLASYQWDMTQIHAPDAHKLATGKGVVVAVLDSGIDDRLVDLAGQVDRSKSVSCIGGAADTSLSWQNDVIGHGSHVAGIIGAKQKNGHGIAGVAPDVTLAAVKLTEDGFIYPEAFVCGMYWAATHNVDLVNASLFVDPFYYNCPNDPQQRALTTAYQRVVAFAALRNVTVFAATSNEEQDLANPTQDQFSPTNGPTVVRNIDSSCKLMPVELPGVVGVSATAANGQMSYYSNYGLGVVDFAAPGGDLHVPAPGNPSGQILSTIPAYSFYYGEASSWNGRVGVGCAGNQDANTNDASGNPITCQETYAVLQGTSQATPHATGVAALAISRFGKLPSAAIVAKMALGAQEIACPSGPYQPFPADMPAETCQGPKIYNGFYGSGQVDALATVRLF